MDFETRGSNCDRDASIFSISEIASRLLNQQRESTRSEDRKYSESGSSDKFEQSFRECENENSEKLSLIQFAQPPQEQFYGCVYRKSRQGRSHDVRERRAAEKKLLENEVSTNNYYETAPDCFLCNRNDCFSDGVCTNCGYVDEDFKYYGNVHLPMPPKSKSYKRSVHYQQRIAQLFGRGPWLPDAIINAIEDFIYETVESSFGEPQFWGQYTFKRIFSILGYSTKLATYWIQVRKRLFGGRIVVLNLHDDNLSTTFYQPILHYDHKTGEKKLIENKLLGRPIWIGGLIPWQVTIDDYTLLRMKMKYECVSRAFDAVLNKRLGSTHPLARNNILNLNYVQVQLARQESVEIFEHIAPFLVQLNSSNQPRINNERWQIINSFCAENFALVTDPISGENFYFDWPYIPLTEEDIEKYFTYFH